MIDPTVITSFYGWTLGFNATDYQKHLKKVAKAKAEMGEKYLLSQSNYMEKKQCQKS